MTTHSMQEKLTKIGLPMVFYDKCTHQRIVHDNAEKDVLYSIREYNTEWMTIRSYQDVPVKSIWLRYSDHPDDDAEMNLGAGWEKLSIETIASVVKRLMDTESR